MDFTYDKQQLNKMCKENSISYLALFGSYARGEETPESDVDLLIDYADSKSYFDHVRIERRLEELFNRNVDLVTRRSLHPYIKDYVYNDLKTLYAN